MKRFGGVVLTGIGVVLVSLGLLFIIAADGQGRRLAVGFIGLALGAVAAGVGVRAFKAADAESPEQIEVDILELARQRNGELSASDLEAALGRRSSKAPGVVEALLARGTCRRTSEEGEAYLVFPHLQPRLQARFCEYCDTELALNFEADKCPNCGGVIETRVATRSVSEGELFSMD